MARKCKCKICKTELTTDNAYKVVVNNKNTYYCNKEEYEKDLQDKKNKENCYETIQEILNEPFITPIMKKEIKALNKFYSNIVIERTFRQYEDKIKWFLNNKEYNTEYAKTRYIITIIKNNISSTYKEYIQEQKEMENLFKKNNNFDVDVDIINNTTICKEQNKNDISEFLD